MSGDEYLFGYHSRAVVCLTCGCDFYVDFTDQRQCEDCLHLDHRRQAELIAAALEAAEEYLPLADD